MPHHDGSCLPDKGDRFGSSVTSTLQARRRVGTASPARDQRPRVECRVSDHGLRTIAFKSRRLRPSKTFPPKQRLGSPRS
jgi:hypothetical protein